MYIGADYYPEHWPRERWPIDAKLMQQAGFNIVRLAEFSWKMLEPAEGKYDFAWLDDALAILRKHGISAILGTPTAVVPAWVAKNYPEVMAEKTDGQRVEWGVRKDQCYTSGKFQSLSDRVVRAMADHFRKTPNVIGWQTDNEFGGAICYCDSCRGEFQSYLRAKFKTLDAFNTAMGKHFWGQYAGSWAEIEIPENDGTCNPSLGLEWKRFVSWLSVRFQRTQVKILREVCPKQFITHNLMGTWAPQVNYFDLAEDLDFVSWDAYPCPSKPEFHPSTIMASDLMRGCKKKNFWIMESTSGPFGWGAYGRNPRPGEMRCWAFQQFAHGCDSFVWFRWRACTAGREQYWHGILGHDARPLRRYRETSAIAKELRGLAKHWDGTTVKAKVAFIFDYDSRWAVEMQPGYGGNQYIETMLRYYSAFARAGVNVDMVKPGDDLSEYKLVLAPDLYVMPDTVAKQIVGYVRKGGVFFCDARTGVKDETGLCHVRTLPGLLSPALGIEIEEYESVGEPEGYKLVGTGAMQGEFTGEKAADWVTPKRAESVVGYTAWHMKKFAAMTRNEYGKGVGWHCGTVAKEPAFYDKLIAALLKDAGVRAVCKPPEGVEASVREGDGKKLLFLINFTEEKKIVNVPEGKKDLISGRKMSKTLELARLSVALIKL